MKKFFIAVSLLTLVGCESYRILLVTEIKTAKEVGEADIQALRKRVFSELGVREIRESERKMTLRGLTQICFGVDSINGVIAVCGKERSYFVASSYKDHNPNEKRFDVETFRNRSSKQKFEVESLEIHDKIVKMIAASGGSSRVSERLTEMSEFYEFLK